MLLVGVIRDAMTQISMERQRVKLILQIIAVQLHRRGHRLLGIRLAVIAQPVGFVIQQVIATVMAEHKIDKAF
ncbi:hypothetical protein D1872_267980 [compost metagenome]